MHKQFTTKLLYIKSQNELGHLNQKSCHGLEDLKYVGLFAEH